MLRHGVASSIVVLCAAALAGCSDDASDNASGGAGTGAGKGATDESAAGRGAAGASAGVGAAGIGGGATSIKCGSATCEAPAAAMGFIAACCADEATSTCGTALMGSACSKPAASDPRCPSLQAMGVFTIPGCCTADGQCGIDAAMFGFGGCTDLAAAAQQSMMSGSGTLIPPPRACDDADAGTDDAGL